MILRLVQLFVVSAVARCERWEVNMGPKFLLGVRQFRQPLLNASNSRAACPGDRAYCIDTRHSDSWTCMWPAPIEIKECLDESCRATPENDNIFKKFGEDSYCKDFAAPEGRVCQWTTDTFCTCAKYKIVYTNAVPVLPRQRAPTGYAFARECEYADNYKAINKREPIIVDATQKPLLQQNRKNGPVMSSPEIGRASLAVVLLILLVLH